MNTPNTEYAPQWHDAAWRWARRRTYIAVRADEVRRGDLYANGATVTSSRKARTADVTWGLPKVNGDEVPLAECWHIACGTSFSLTCAADSPVIVGRVQNDGYNAPGDLVALLEDALKDTRALFTLVADAPTTREGRVRLGVVNDLHATLTAALNTVRAEQAMSEDEARL